MLAFMMLLAPVPARADITTGLVGWWKFDGGTSGSIANNTTVGFEDSSGQGNNGTAKNANGTGMAWAQGKISGAVSFDGVDDYVDAGNPTSLQMTDTFSVSAWVKQVAVSTNSSPVGKVTVSSAGWMFYQTGAQTVRFYVYNYANSRANSGQLLPLNEWVHVVGVSTPTITCIYLNGVQHCENKGAGAYVESANSLKIGNGYNPFLGSVDDVRVYNRALTQADVTELYNYTGPPEVIKAHIVRAHIVHAHF